MAGAMVTVSMLVAPLTAPGVAQSSLAAASPAVVSNAGGAAVGTAVGNAVGYHAPVTGPLKVLTPFEPPPTAYSAGHRGTDLAAGRGSAVLAVGTGVVRFAGSVAGRGIVVVLHPDGVSTEYEPLAPSVQTGQSVRLGETLGRLTGHHDGCAPADCLHWGARRGEEYLDPMSLLRPLGVVTLLPWSAETGAGSG
jgi:murein DD-endopeptidase MepM/ murein hydrolase activator NlpD